MDANAFLPAYCTKSVLLLGCGNRLFGDDGFGPAVIERLSADYAVPDDVYLMDVGTGVREILFTLCLGDALPREIVIIDAIDDHRIPGEIFEISIDGIPLEKADDFSLHQAPTANLAKELRAKGVAVNVLACQSRSIPQTISAGLSEPVASAVLQACETLARRYSFPALKPSDEFPECSLYDDVKDDTPHA